MFNFSRYFEENNTLIIAEFANAFEGKKDLALEMIEKAVEADVDALKFQIFFADELLIREHPQYEVFKRLETSANDWHDILDCAFKTKKLIFADIYGDNSFALAQDFSIDAFKIPPTEMNNFSLIHKVSSCLGSLILSAGAATFEDIESAIEICRKNNNTEFAIMHGFQAYPTKLEDTNLNLLETLNKTFNCPVGYADHIDGDSDIALNLPLIAVAKGAKLIEKHFTLNRELKGIDYESSINPEELKKLVQYIKNLEVMFGQSFKELSIDEVAYKKNVRKRAISRRELTRGTVLDEQDLIFKRAPSGIFAEKMGQIIGKTLLKDVKANHALEWEFID